VIRFGGEIVYIDPYLNVPDSSIPYHRGVPVLFPPEEIRKAKAIMSTHEHEDHCDERTVKALHRNTDALFVGPSSSAAKALEWGYESARILTVRPGDKHKLSRGIEIFAFDSSDAYAEAAVTYLVKTQNGNIFHSGDTSYFGGLRQIGREHRVDVALLNFGKQIPTPKKPYYMSAEGVAMAARDLRAATIIPIHWDLWLEARDEPKSIKTHLETISPNSHLLILNVGEKFELNPNQ